MKDSIENYYTEKDSSYYRNVRTDILKLLPKNHLQSVLEIGAGGGDTLRYIKEKKLAKYVCGVELFELDSSNQKHSSIDHFVVANIEHQDLRLDQKKFDVIILADVLEHLNDPWKTLNYVEQFVKLDGLLLISLPNFREINALKKVFFKGNFGYTEHGIFDKTHLRFFCKKNMIQMIASPDRKILDIYSNLALRKGNTKRKILNKASFNLLEEFLSLQFFFKVRIISNGENE